jgi:hypothetical protein
VEESDWAIVSKDEGRAACATETEADNANTTNAKNIFMIFLNFG